MTETLGNGLHWVLRKLALAPPLLKTTFFSRACGKLARWCGLDGKVTTNLGIAGHLRVEYPDARHFAQVFGLPFHYRGERGGLHLVENLLPDCDAFIDVGAYIGYYTYFAASQNRDIPVVFLEPNPELSRFISETAKRNSLTNVDGYNIAVGDRDQIETFYVDQVDDTRSSLAPYTPVPSKAIQVPVVTFDTFLEGRAGFNRTFVKVDVENTEFKFLRGALRNLSRVQYLVLETLLAAQREGIVREVMQAGSFFAYYINDFRLEHSPDGTFLYSAGELNWLFCRLSPEALARRLARSKFRVISR